MLYERFKRALDQQAYRIPLINKAVVNYRCAGGRASPRRWCRHPRPRCLRPRRSVALATSASRRVGWDISPSWQSFMGLAYMAEPLWAQARPGDAGAGVSSFYTDIEMLEVGNGHLSADEAAAHFALWCVMHAPLVISTDVARLSAADLALLSNEEAIAIDQV